MLKSLTVVGIGLALFDVDVAAVGGHGGHIVANEPSGSQHVDTAALIPALVYAVLDGVINTRGGVGVDGLGIQTIGHPGHHQAAAAVIEQPHHVAVLDALLLSQLMVDVADQIGVAVDNHAVLGNLPQPLGVLLIMGMIVEPRMGRDQAIGILVRRQALEALP